MPFDAGEFERSEAAKLGAPARLSPIIGPNGTPLDEDTWIDLYGIDSQKYQDANFKIQQRRLDNAAATGNGASMRVETIDAERTELIAHCTAAWGGFVKDGNPLQCNVSNALWLYRTLPWLRPQVERFMGNRASFLQQPSANSQNGSN